ncbi:Fructose-bisphosphate aldolase [Symbiodinium microadriaticum]|uniref:fructose-bisphosphate aldolase n=1 Tax=Symbiodinium microadriaticum TaxID=2951 RepID=A0A1Q9DYY5_SYMMI|nr:Fructose-bisphosphate aldolase [Symbiodinium microadriaticum]
MSEPPEPTPRSLAASGPLEAAQVAELTGQVFQSLANGKDTIGIREFKSTAKFLAQLSEDFSADPEEAFSRIDENQDHRIDRAEFEQEISQIRGLLGTRKLAAALGQVQQDLQIRQSFTEEAAVESAPPEVGTLEARTQVLEQMVGYFSTLRDDYSQKLEELKQQEAMQGKARAPPRARVFAGRSKKGLSDTAKSLQNAFLGASARLEIKRQYTHQDDFDGPESHAQGQEPAEDAADDEEGEDDEGENQELEEEDASDDEDEEENEDDLEEEEDDEEDDEEGEEDDADEAQEDEATQLIAAMSAGETPSKCDLEATLPPGSIPEESQLPETTQPPAAPAGPSSPEPEATAEAEATTAEVATADVATAAAAMPVSEAPAPSAQPSGGTKKTKASKKKPKAKPKKEPKKAQPAPAPSKVDSQRPSLSGATVTEPSSTKSQSTPSKPVKKSTDEEGFRCVQTLEMGLAVRNAICIGTEVWTVDWAGNVTVRERDDATKVRSEIPTNRFVWSMLHMEPHLMWMGQEAMGISLFDTKRKEFKGSLMGGHTGGVTCLASGDALDSSEMKEGHIPRRRAWSGSNDFTIRQWTIETWHSKDPGPQVKDAFVLELGKFKVAISKGLQMHGHKNGVRCMIRIGPTLWSGSDDGTIRLWCTATGACNEVVEKAHTGSVLKLSVVRSFIWSSGIDGFIREWTIGGAERQCVRQIAPEGFAKGAYAIVPLGHEVWTCGHHPNIQVFSQSDFFKTAGHPAHDPYVSNLLTVDRIETKIVWSTSIGDKKLKVWRHTIRGEVPSVDELKAANRLFEEEEEVRAQRMDEFVKRASKLEDELAVSAEEYRAQLEALATDLAKSKAQEEELEARCKHLEDELDGIRQLFEEMGLGKLMEDPEALARFLQRARSLEKIFKDLGLEHFLDNPEALRQVLEAFADLGLEHLLKNPEELKSFLQSAKQLQEMLEAAGFGDVFGDPSKLEELKQSLDLLRRVRDLFEKYGLGDAFKDPALLEEILSRYEGLRKAFEEYGFSELFEDPYNLKGFLRNYAKLREAFKDLGLEYLLDSAAAMRDFLAGHTSGEKELLDLRAKASRLDEAEEKLRRRDEELARAREEAKQMRDRLAAFEAIGDLESIKKWKSEASELRALMRAKGNVDTELTELRALLEEKERERQEGWLLHGDSATSCRFWDIPGMKAGVVTGDLAWALLQHAKANKYAIPAFNCTSSSVINSVLEAGKELNRPVMIQFSEGGAAFVAGKSLPNEKGKLQASILGAVAGAHFVRAVAPAYGIPVIVHSDHCAKKLLPWFDGMLEADEAFFKQHGEPLFSSHMLDLSEEPDEENIAICAKYLTRMAPMKQILEMEIGITGGVEDGVDNSGAAKEKLYSTPADVFAVYKALNPISPMFTIAAAFGNVHGVYKAGNVVLKPELLEEMQVYAREQIKSTTGQDIERPLNFVFHGGSGSEKHHITTALNAGVVKMNVDTDTQWAYWEGLLKFYKAKEGYLQGQIGNPEGFYDPRKWIRECENSMVKRVKEHQLSRSAATALGTIVLKLSASSSEGIQVTEALERERMMAIKYKELDIFKLDIIARELKSLDNELGLVGKEAKFLQQSAGRLKDFGDQQQILQHGSKMLDQCVQLRSHIRDVIHKCLSETQKLHIGAPAIDDPLAAGELKDGGVMAGFVCEEVDAPVHGSSKAARLRQGDEMARERRIQSGRPSTGGRPTG